MMPLSSSNDRVHVLPRGDLIEHEADEDCVCGPDTEFVDGEGQVIVHHSLDGREEHEDA